MNKIMRILVGLAAFCILTLETSSILAEEITYTVSDGDTMGGIAARHGVTIDQIVSWNRGLNPDRIRIGQEITINTESSSSSYVVRDGDTLSRIASRNGVSIDDIMSWNRGINANRLRIGQEITIQSESSSSSSSTYVVRDGDTMGGIASSHNVTIDQIVGWNRGLNPDRIRVGQEITIQSESSSSTSSSSSSNSSSSSWQNYTVVSGDTLSRIASRHDITMDEIIGWNRGLNPDRLRVGQEIRLQSSRRGIRRVEYEVQPGDFLGRIASQNNITIDQIVSWNSGLNPDRLQIGQTLVFMFEGPEQISESIGRANDGRLVNGEELPEHRMYDIRSSRRAWGTNETISNIVGAFDHLRSVHRNAPVLDIHDLSYEEGGRISDHRSHQSGRDADIGYYHDECEETCEYTSFRAGNMDLELNWSIIHYWLDNDLVEYIFIDYSYQEVLYEYAEDHGASERQLRAWFQYPRGRNTARGIIRHERNHRDHMHVRFGCSSEDGNCR